MCSLDQELTLLQQGCDITGGNYLKVPQLSGLLQYLLVKEQYDDFLLFNAFNFINIYIYMHLFDQWIFLPDPNIRSKLVLPPPVKVDYRAACFCHQELIDIGYVCSICLSSKRTKFVYSNIICQCRTN